MISEYYFLNIIIVFLCTSILDWVWAKYTIEVTNRNPLKSSLLASILYAGGGYMVITYTTDHFMLLPAILGAFCGTYLAVKKN